MPWEKSYNETIVLDRAARAFWRRGYEATSMAELVRVTGVNRGSLYAAFEDKRTLFLRALEHYDQTYYTSFLNEIENAHEPKDAILAVFDAAAVQGDDRPNGCLLINSATEMSPRDYEIAQFIEARLQEVEDFFHDNVQRAVKDRTVRRDIDVRHTAQTLLGLFIGLQVLIRASARTAAISTIKSQVRAMLG